MNKEIEKNVNHPQHYESASVKVERIYEPIDLCGLYGFCMGNALKYICRAKYKNNYIEDLAKAQWYLKREFSKLAKTSDQIFELYEYLVSQDMIIAFRKANHFIKDLINDFGGYSCESINKVINELEDEITTTKNNH